MKFYSVLIFCFFISAILCENGGVKVAINQRLIDSFLDFFFQNLTDLIQKRPIENSGMFYNMEYGVNGLTRNKVQLNFESNGYIHVKVSGVSPYIRGNANFLGKKSFKAYAEDFYLELYINIKSKQIANGRYAPKIEIPSTPKLDLSVDGEVSGGIIGFIINTLGKLVLKVVNLILPIIKKIVLKNVTDRINKLDIILPTSTVIDSSKGLYLNFDLASPVKLRNRFLELNSIAFLYNKNIQDTQNSKRYQLSYLPDFNNMDNQFQLYVSEYFLNSAIYTLLKTHQKPIKVPTDTSIINAMLPGIVEVYGKKGAVLTINNLENSNIKLTNNYIDINAIGDFAINVDEITDSVYKCQIELSIRAKLVILTGPILSGEIENISAKVTKTLYNSNQKIKTPLIGSVLEAVNILFVPLLKELTKNDFKLKFPSVLGIEFKDVTLDIKNQYFVVNYNFNQVRGGGRRGDGAGSFGGSGHFTGRRNSTRNNDTSTTNGNGNFGGNRSNRNTTNINGNVGGRRSGGSTTTNTNRSSFGGSRTTNTNRNGNFGGNRTSSSSNNSRGFRNHKL